MSKYKIPVYIRVALWEATTCRCFYCDQPISFIDLQIDHVIPETTSPDRLQQLIVRLGLPREFTLNCTRNLVPTHHGCNGKKSDQEFSEGTLRFYLENWERRQGDIECKVRNLRDQSKNERLLTRLSSRIEAGFISVHEVNEFIGRFVPSSSMKTSEPLVVTFGVNVMDLLGSTGLPDDAPHSYVPLCDWFEQNLVTRIRESIASLSVQSEASDRNRESLSVRIAFWNLDVAVLEKVSLSPWKVLEIASYSEIYDASWNELFPRAVVQTYHDVIHDKNSKFRGFHLAMCPQCGSTQLEERMSIDYEHDEDYYFIECKECGWGDWTQ